VTAGVPPVGILLPSVLPDSIRLKILARLAQGDITGAIALWQVHTGRTDIPKILLDLQLAFQVANRRMGACGDVARTIHSGFRYFGGKPEYIRISSTGGELLSWQNRAIMSDNNFHVAVRQSGRVFDAFTGPAGMLEKEYVQNIILFGEPIIRTVAAP
jgi:hypothetical protein